jgi:hypothetical protein
MPQEQSHHRVIFIRLTEPRGSSAKIQYWFLQCGELTAAIQFERATGWSSPAKLVRKTRSSTYSSIFTLLVLSGTLHAQVKENTSELVPDGEIRVADAVRVDRPPKLDGTLDDALWQSAKPVTDFRQREPYEGKRPTERTEFALCTQDMPSISAFTVMIQSLLGL